MASLGMINIAVLTKDSELYVFVWDDAGWDRLEGVLDRFASDPRLSFGRYDACEIMYNAHKMKLGDQTAAGGRP